MAGQTGSKDKTPTPAPTPSGAPPTSAPKSTGSKVREALRGQDFETQEAALTPGGNTHGLGPTEAGGKGREGEVARNKNNSRKDREGQIFEVPPADVAAALDAFSAALRGYASHIVTYGEVHGANVTGGLGAGSGDFDACLDFACGNQVFTDSRFHELVGYHLSGPLTGAVSAWLSNTRLRPDVMVFPEFASWTSSPVVPPTRSRSLTIHDFMQGPDSVSRLVQGVLSAHRFRSPGLAQGLADRFAIWRSSLRPTFMGEGTVKDFPTPGPVVGRIISMSAFD